MYLPIEWIFGLNNMKIRITIVILFTFIFSPIYSASAKNDEPLSIDAQSVKIYEKNNTVVYTGRVKLAQGEIIIKANQIIAYTRNSKVETVTASGQPIRIVRKKRIDSEAILITGKKFKYQVHDKQLTLSGSVKIQQGKDTFTSDTIFYDIKKDHLIAESRSSGQQVQAIIYSKQDK